MAAAVIRSPSAEERTSLLPLAAKGWANAQELPEGMWIPETAIEGKVPLELHGTFFRNGPGFNVVYGTQLAHPIDGDGIVAALSFADGKVHFRSRFVQTKTHVEEAKAQKMLYNGNMGTRAPKDTVRPGWRDPAHTNVFHWGSRLLACHEYALPHALNPTTLETLGADTLNNNLELKVVSAHYRYDADLDVLVCVAFKAALKPTAQPRVSFYEFDRSMTLKHVLRMEIPAANYAHDFCLTPSWMVMHISPFIDTRPETLREMQKKELFPGETMKYVQGIPSQFCLIERRPRQNASPKILRFDIDPCHIYHYVNCRENAKTGVITFSACCLPVGFTMEWKDHVFLANSGDAPGVMHEYTISPREGSCVRTRIPGLETTSCEFPTANQYRHVPRSVKTKTDIFYLMASQPSVALPFTDVVKYNAATGAVSRWHAPFGVVGEPCFMPRLGRASAWHGEEDDGWVIVQVFKYKENRVEFVVLNAKQIHSGPVCTIKLPVHLSIGFHGTVSE
jgi:all-trans-8'-apo-beta-carotenal 15,15'-oxygenase